jgi:hypothetical protein
MCLVNHKSLLRTLAIYGIGMIASGSFSAFSGEVYSYTGPDYSPMDCGGTYVANCTSDHLTGSFTTTLSLSQLENLASYSIPLFDIAGFSFSDGNGLTLSQANATVSILGITTNGSGDMNWWEIQLTGTGGSSFIYTLSCLPSTCPGGPTGGQDTSGTSAIDSGATSFEPLGQIWSTPQFIGAPEASGAFLVGLGFIVLAGFSVIRRHRRLTFRG